MHYRTSIDSVHYITCSDTREKPRSTILPLVSVGSHQVHYHNFSGETPGSVIVPLVTVGNHYDPLSYL